MFTLYTDSQTVTELTNGPVLTNTDDAVSCVNADKSVSGCRFVAMPGQRRCEFCYKFMVSENGLRRHLLLHHRRVYMRYEDPYYVVDDNEYAERCARMRHNQSHRRAAARRRETATGSVSAGVGTWPAQNNRGTMTPQNKRGTMAPQNRQKVATRQQQPRAARGKPVANFPLPVASTTSKLSTFGWKPKPKIKFNGYGNPYTSKDRVLCPSHEGLQFDQFVKAMQYSADLGAYQRQCARDERDYVASSTSGSESDVEQQASPSPENYAFKRQSSNCVSDESLKSLTIAKVEKPTFYLADCDVQLDAVDDVTSESTTVRGVSEGESAVVYLDAEKQSNSMPDFLDDFLYEHAKELDSEVGVLDYIVLSVENAGLNLVEPAWTSDEEAEKMDKPPPIADVHAEDAAAVVSLLAATTPTVDTAVSPILDYVKVSVENAGLNLVEPTWTSGEENLGTTGGSPSATVVRAEPSPAAPSAATAPVVDTAVSPVCVANI